ncbi:Ctr copper transporter, partial [Mortierella sp. GBAus27b]
SMPDSMTHSMSGGFQSGLGTAVWSPSLTPMSEPQYIGALIGLFLLSIAFRALAASQGYLEAYLHLHYYPRPASSSGSHGSRSRPLQQLEQEQTSLLWPLPTAQPFVWQAEVSRAVVATAVVGIGYMLMLVVMTYNSAYFGVILAGVFFGEVYFGRW